MQNFKRYWWILIIVLIAIYFLFFRKKNYTLQTVSLVDLKKYSGKWYEIASYPKYFENNCYCTTAEYTLTENGYVTVENRCNLASPTGKESYIKGKAFVEQGSNNSKLEVQFFWPFTGKYWIIDLAPDYSYAVVAHPNKNSLWILSRTPKIDDATYAKITDVIKAKGFDLSKLQKTDQSCSK